MNDVFSKKYLLESLKRAGVPYSYKSLLLYEKKGIIPKPENAIGFGRGSKWRLYRQDEINDIVARVVAYKKV